jgi:hypothetical protein
VSADKIGLNTEWPELCVLESVKEFQGKYFSGGGSYTNLDAFVALPV